MQEQQWKLVFEETFQNFENWNYDIGSGVKNLWGNNEKQFYTSRSKNSYMKDGELHIVANCEIYEDCNYTSARLVTKNKIHIQYGYIEVCAKVPRGKGSWPAIWMLGVNDTWPLCGEIDIMEHLGRKEDKIHHAIHSKNHICKPYNSFSEQIDNVCSEYHAYGIYWEKDRIEFYVDRNAVGTIIRDKEYKTKEDWPYNNYFYLILNCAVGGDWPGLIDDNSLPYDFAISSIKIYQTKNHSIIKIKEV